MFRNNLKDVRKFLIDNAVLKTVVSLPRGVFLPYTGVKTNILYFTDCHTKKTENKIWYFDVKNDGFTLDNHRKRIKDNDLKKIDYVDFLKKQENENILEIGFQEINLKVLENNSYNLVGNFYLKDIVSKGFITIQELIEKSILFAKKGKTITSKTIEKGDIPVIAGGQSSPYSHNKYNYKKNIITMSASGAYSGFIWYHDAPIWASDCSVLFSNNENILMTKYLYFCLKSKQNKIYKKQHGAGQPHVYIKDIKYLAIPLLPILEQQTIVNDLDKKQALIDKKQNEIKSIEQSLKNDINSMWTTEKKPTK